MSQSAVSRSHDRRWSYVRRRDRYADRLRRIPDFCDLTRAEARLLATLVDEVVVDGRRVLVFGARELEALVAAVPRLAARLLSWPAECLPTTCSPMYFELRPEQLARVPAGKSAPLAGLEPAHTAPEVDAHLRNAQVRTGDRNRPRGAFPARSHD